MEHQMSRPHFAMYLPKDILPKSLIRLSMSCCNGTYGLADRSLSGQVLYILIQLNPDFRCGPLQRCSRSNSNTHSAQWTSSLGISGHASSSTYVIPNVLIT